MPDGAEVGALGEGAPVWAAAGSAVAPGPAALGALGTFTAAVPTGSRGSAGTAMARLVSDTVRQGV